MFKLLAYIVIIVMINFIITQSSVLNICKDLRARVEKQTKNCGWRTLREKVAERYRRRWEDNRRATGLGMCSQKGNLEF